jgi:hypothetical protein
MSSCGLPSGLNADVLIEQFGEVGFADGANMLANYFAALEHE